MGRTATRTRRPVVEDAPPGSVEEFRDRIQAAFRAQYPPTDTAWSYVVGTFPAEGYVIVCAYGETGESYARHDYTEDAAGVLIFGAPQALELVYVPADIQGEAARVAAVRRDGRRRVTERPALEATRDGQTLAITVIREGFNTSRTRYYTAAAIESGRRAFAGPLKMYLNHQTRAEEQARPEGDLRDWVASLMSVEYDAASHRLVGSAKITDPAFAEKVRLLDEQGLLNTLGVSIRAIGAGEDTLIEGTRTFRVDEFTAARSVDFVTEPGAGGGVEWLEAASEDSDIDSITLARLRERRPDLVRALSNEARELEDGMTPEEQAALDAAKRDAAEARAAAEAAHQETAVAQAALEAERAERAQEKAQESIARLITEASVGDAGTKYLRETLANESDVEKAKVAIESFKAAVAQQKPAGSTVRGMGETVEDGEKPNLKGAFERLGLSEASAAVAARGGR